MVPETRQVLEIQMQLANAHIGAGRFAAEQIDLAEEVHLADDRRFHKQLGLIYAKLGIWKLALGLRVEESHGAFAADMNLATEETGGRTCGHFGFIFCRSAF